MLEPGVGVGASEAQQLVDEGDVAQQGAFEDFVPGVGVEGFVGGGDHLVHDGQGFGSVQVVGHRFFERLDEARFRFPDLAGSEAFFETVEFVQAFFGCLEVHFVEVEVVAVMNADEVEAQELSRIDRQGVFEEKAVAQALGHFFPVDLDEAVVHPVFGDLVARGAAGLGRFVFVVGEKKVGAAAVDVDGVLSVALEVLLDHRRTFDMPAGASAAQLGVEADIPLSGAGFPEGEVPGVALFSGLDFAEAAAGLFLVAQHMGDLAVVLVFARIEVDIPALGAVGAALFDEPFYHRLNGVERFSGFGFDVGPAYAQSRHLFQVALDVVVGELLEALARFVDLFDDLVVDVGEVLGQGYFVAQGPQGSREQVEAQGAAGVAQVGFVVDGGAADVDRGFAGTDRFEGDFGFFDGIEDLHLHRLFLRGK